MHPHVIINGEPMMEEETRTFNKGTEQLFKTKKQGLSRWLNV